MCEMNQVNLIETDLSNMSKRLCLLFVLITLAASVMNTNANMWGVLGGSPPFPPADFSVTALASSRVWGKRLHIRS